LSALIAVVAAIAAASMFGTSSVADQHSTKRVETRRRLSPGSWFREHRAGTAGARMRPDFRRRHPCVAAEAIGASAPWGQARDPDHLRRSRRHHPRRGRVPHYSLPGLALAKVSRRKWQTNRLHLRGRYLWNTRLAVQQAKLRYSSYTFVGRLCYRLSMFVTRATAAAISGVDFLLARLTGCSGPWRARISAMRLSTAIVWPSGPVVMSE
jgi:hypothetical protein